MVVVRFTLGGLIEVMSDEACHGSNANPIQTILGSGIAATASAKVVETLRAAANEDPRNQAPPLQPESL